MRTGVPKVHLYAKPVANSFYRMATFFQKKSFIYLVVSRKKTIFVALIPGSL